MSSETDGSPFSGEETQSLGSLLRERREARGLSLDDAVAQTRIRRSFLEALEEDRFGEIPGETYVYGFLRTYATLLGFNPNEIITLYNERFHGASIAAPAREEKSGEIPFVRRHRWLLPVILLIMLAAILIGVLMSKSESAVLSETVSGAEEAGVPATSHQSGKIKGLPVETGRESPADTDPSAVVDSAGGPVLFVPFGGALLKAECRDKGWMEITVDDRPVQRYRLEPKSILKWRIEKTFHIQIERSGLLTLWLDGQKVQLGEQTALYVGPEPVSDGQ